MVQGHKKKGKQGHKYSFKTSRRTKFELPHADVLYEALAAETQTGQAKPLPLNEDLPGLGQFYCNVSGCAAYVHTFSNPSFG